jgi:hypothetical protein
MLYRVTGNGAIGRIFLGNNEKYSRYFKIFFIITRKEIIPIAPIPVTPCTYLYITFLHTGRYRTGTCNEGTKTLLYCR